MLKMFKKQFIVFTFLLITLSSISAENQIISLDDIIANIDKANDPNDIGKNIKTLTTEIELSIPEQKISMQLTIKDKFPDKSKKTTEIVGISSVINIINDFEAWEISQNNVRVITGRELEFNKFQLLMKNPTKKFKDVFKDIKLEEGSFQIGKNDCIKLICTPNTYLEFSPLTMYFSKKDFLLQRMEMMVETPLGQILIVSMIEEYKKINGRIVPVKTKTMQNGITIESKLISVKENIDIPDSEFENPTPVEVIK